MRFDRNDLAEVLGMVKRKLDAGTGSACGLFWADTLSKTSKEEDVVEVQEQPINKYGIREEEPVRVTTMYAVGEED